jgi:hypothetical protein
MIKKSAIRPAHRGRVLRAAAGRREERPLEVDPDQRPVLDQRSGGRQSLDHRVLVRGDQARDQTGGPVREVVECCRTRIGRLTVRERATRSTVAMQIDQARQDRRADHLWRRPGRRRSGRSRADPADALTSDRDQPIGHGRAVGHDATTQHQVGSFGRGLDHRTTVRARPRSVVRRNVLPEFVIAVALDLFTPVAAVAIVAGLVRQHVAEHVFAR